MYEHYADAIADPDHIRLADDLVCLRFEVMKTRSALGAVRHLLATGQIRPGDTLVDAKHYKSDTVTEIKEYEGMAHLLPAQQGWEEIADYVLAWAVKQAGWPAINA